MLFIFWWLAPPDLVPALNPWKDAPWKDIQWTVYRGKAYDLQPFFDAHPAGNWLLNLAIQRDSTACWQDAPLATTYLQTSIVQ